MGPHLKAAIDDAGLEERDERDLMPLEEARSWLRGRTRFDRGQGQRRGQRHVWEADRTWAALLSLSEVDEFLAAVRFMEWKHPPRGRDNAAPWERYGDGILPWIQELVAEAGALPAQPWCLRPCLLRIGGEEAGRLALSLGADLLGDWLERQPAGWARLGDWMEAELDGPPDDPHPACDAAQQLSKVDAGGLTDGLSLALGEARWARLREALSLPQGEPDERVRAVVLAVPALRVERGMGLSWARIRQAWREYACPMWDNANWLCGGIRFTGFADPLYGDALVAQALATGLGDAGLRVETWRFGGEPASRPVHIDVLLHERQIYSEDGQTRLLTGERYDPRSHEWVAPEAGLRGSIFLAAVGQELPFAVDTAGFRPEVAEVLEGVGGPEARLLVRIGQKHREAVFPGGEVLRERAGLSPAAVQLFSFDGAVLPLANEPPESSADLRAMVEAIRQRRPIERLPYGGHPLAGLYDRLAVARLGPW